MSYPFRYGVVIPNRYPDIIMPLVESIHRYIPKPLPRIMVVADGHNRDYGFEIVHYKSPRFVFAESANLGMKSLGDLDIILLNDDCRIIQDDFFTKLADQAQVPVQDRKIGILSPLIKGCVGNELQRWHNRQAFWEQNYAIRIVRGTMPICFPCVWISREMIRAIGQLDESYTSYGGEDVEYSSRARREHWLTAITNGCVVQHGDGGEELVNGRGKTWSLSYARRGRGQG